MKQLNLTNAGLILGAVAAFYMISKAVKWNSAMENLVNNNENIPDVKKQYAPQWSQNYDWMQGADIAKTVRT